jgi:hypothetical protein
VDVLLTCSEDLRVTGGLDNELGVFDDDLVCVSNDASTGFRLTGADAVAVLVQVPVDVDAHSVGR